MPEDYSQGWIDLGDIDPKDFIRTVHELSHAQGMGFIHERPEPLNDEEMKHWLEQLEEFGNTRLDYVRGRSCKMSLHKHDGHYFIREGSWYDHTDEELEKLLVKFGVSQKTTRHGNLCACDDCRPKS